MDRRRRGSPPMVSRRRRRSLITRHNALSIADTRFKKAPANEFAGHFLTICDAAKPRRYAAMARQVSTQARHASAHALQWSWSWAPHCSAHHSHTSAHSLQISLANRLSLAIAWEHNKQMSIHSRQHLGQSLSLFISIIACKQRSHSVAHF